MREGHVSTLEGSTERDGLSVVLSCDGQFTSKLGETLLPSGDGFSEESPSTAGGEGEGCAKRALPTLAE
eukprot:1695013-Amphidinium_carterae.4